MKSQMTVGKKISIVCALLVVFTITLGAVALVSMARMETATQSIVGDALPGVYSISRAESVAKDHPRRHADARRLRQAGGDGANANHR